MEWREKEFEPEALVQLYPDALRCQLSPTNFINILQEDQHFQELEENTVSCNGNDNIFNTTTTTNLPAPVF